MTAEADRAVHAPLIRTLVPDGPFKSRSTSVSICTLQIDTPKHTPERERSAPQHTFSSRDPEQAHQSLRQGSRVSSSPVTATAAAAAVHSLMDSATFSMPAEVFVGAARVTAVYATMFAALIIWQGMSKLRLAAACQAKKEPFDRLATCSSCHAVHT